MCTEIITYLPVHVIAYITWNTLLKVLCKIYLTLYNNTTSNAIVNTASNISYRPLIQVDVFAVLFMDELKNLTNVVIGKLGTKLFSRLFLYFINYNIIIAQVRYITTCIETKEVACIGYNSFLFLQ